MEIMENRTESCITKNQDADEIDYVPGDAYLPLLRKCYFHFKGDPDW